VFDNGFHEAGAQPLGVSLGTDKTKVLPLKSLDLPKDIDLDLNYNSQIGVPDPKDSTHHLQAFFSMDIFGDVLDLTANFTWDRIENPVTNAEGVTPERDDYRLAFGIGVDL